MEWILCLRSRRTAGLNPVNDLTRNQSQKRRHRQVKTPNLKTQCRNEAGSLGPGSRDLVEKSSKEEKGWIGRVIWGSWLSEDCTFEIRLYGQEAARCMEKVDDSQGKVGCSRLSRTMPSAGHGVGLLRSPLIHPAVIHSTVACGSHVWWSPCRRDQHPSASGTSSPLCKHWQQGPVTDCSQVPDSANEPISPSWSHPCKQGWERDVPQVTELVGNAASLGNVAPVISNFPKKGNLSHHHWKLSDLARKISTHNKDDGGKGKTNKQTNSK